MQLSKGGFFTLLGLLLTIVIISIIWYMLFNVYFKESTLDKKTGELFPEKGLDTLNRKAILDTTKREIKDINRKLLNREKEIEQ